MSNTILATLSLKCFCNFKLCLNFCITLNWEMNQIFLVFIPVLIFLRSVLLRVPACWKVLWFRKLISLGRLGLFLFFKVIKDWVQVFAGRLASASSSIIARFLHLLSWLAVRWVNALSPLRLWTHLRILITPWVFKACFFIFIHYFTPELEYLLSGLLGVLLIVDHIFLLPVNYIQEIVGFHIDSAENNWIMPYCWLVYQIIFELARKAPTPLNPNSMLHKSELIIRDLKPVCTREQCSTYFIYN